MEPSDKVFVAVLVDKSKVEWARDTEVSGAAVRKDDCKSSEMVDDADTKGGNAEESLPDIGGRITGVDDNGSEEEHKGW
jgi:hypothetical protein